MGSPTHECEPRIDEAFQSFVLSAPRPYSSRAEHPQRRVEEILASLGNPHLGLACVHVAGSKGKGTTALFTESSLLQAGLTVGTFTSPHLEDWTERFRINGACVDHPTLAAMLDRVLEPARALVCRYPDDPPTFFDVATAVALALFRDAGVDIAIIEAGIGGRLDATRVVHPKVCCITTIELEHTDKLGSDRVSIARHKAGIIKPNTPLILGVMAAPAETEITTIARSLSAPIRRVGFDFRVNLHRTQRNRIELDWRNPVAGFSCELPTPAFHIGYDAALAAACVWELGISSPESFARNARAAFPTVELPGRAEIISSDPLIVVDGAHTRASMRALAAMLDQLGAGPLHLVLSLSHHKEVDAVLGPILPHARRITLTRADPSRAQDPATLAGAISARSGAIELRVTPDPTTAIEEAYGGLDPSHALCVTGSVYLAGKARIHLRSLLGDGPSAKSGDENVGAQT